MASQEPETPACSAPRIDPTESGPPGEHQILRQVAGYHTEVIKFLPPLNIAKDDIDRFLAAMGRVLQDIQRVPGAMWSTMAAMAKGAMRAQLSA
jgi:hypothetical protein